MSNATIDAVVFDMDGLMLDTEPLNCRAWQLAAAELGFELTGAQLDELIGRPDDDCYAVLRERYGEGFSIQEFATRWPPIWDRLVDTQGITRKPGLTELLAFLDQLAIPYAVATSSSGANARRSLAHAGLADRFPIIVAGDEVVRGKPAPDIYLEAAERLRLPPARCLAFEDSAAGLTAATSAGMTTILVPDLSMPPPAVRRAAFRVLVTLHDAPEVIVRLNCGGPRP